MKGKKEYMNYIKKKLKKYKVDAPDQIPNKKKRKFFKEVDKGWESKKEKETKKEGENKDLWVKDVQEEIKEKQEGEKPSKPVVKIEKIKEAVLQVTSYKPPEGLFKEPGTQIAKQLLNDSKSPAQAMQRLNFYINRAGSNLGEDDMKRLNSAKKIISEAVEKKSKTAGFWTQKIMTHKNMSKIKNLILDMKEDLMGEDYTEGDEDKFIKDFVHTIDPLLANIKIAPKQPPKGWWEMMKKKIKSQSPEYDSATVDKVVGDIWYNKMDSKKKKEVTEKFES